MSRLYEKDFTLVLTLHEDGWVARFGTQETGKQNSPLRALDLAIRTFVCRSCGGLGRGCSTCSGFGVNPLWRK